MTNPTLEQYTDDVLAWVPGEVERSRVELALRHELARRLDERATIEDAVRQIGDPRDVAEAFLATQPLRSGGFMRRLAAAAIDIPSVMVSGFLFFYFAWKLVGNPTNFIGAIFSGNPIAIGLGFATLALMSPMYYMILESTTGQTIGKWIMGLRVVRESGAKISFGQAFVRQIPLLCSFYVIDAAVALFTEKKQRAFELISKTRVVTTDP